MPRIKVLRNLGTDFYREHGIPKLPDNKMHQEGETYDVTDDVAKILIKAGLGEPAEAFHAVPEPANIRGVPPEAVSQTNESEAIATIALMRSKDKLQNLIDHDSRPAVKEAARKRLAAL